MKIKVYILFMVLSFASVAAFGQGYYGDVEKFRENNPDGDKYEFAKTFINSLTYLRANETRGDKSVILDSSNIENSEDVGSLMDSLTLDSVNWRVSRNLLKKYKKPENGLMLKVTDLFLKLSEEQISLNSQERFLLGQLFEAQISGKMDGFDKYNFFEESKIIVGKRKQSLAKLLEASLLLNKVMISDVENEYGELVRLGITDKERDKLLYKLEEFYEDEDIEGGLQEGQSFLKGSIYSFHEFLSDYSWKALDDY